MTEEMPARAHPDAAEHMPPLERLKTLLADERVKLGVHIRKMNSPGSPVYRYGENVLPAGAVLVGSFAATVLLHFYLGAAVLALGCWWWLGKVQPKVRDGVYERSAAWALADERNFDALWAKGVLSLYAKLPDGRELAATRRDDWRAFAQALPLDPGAP
jgi:hypothetical protein